jgi:hypothetical protein
MHKVATSCQSTWATRTRCTRRSSTTRGRRSSPNRETVLPASGIGQTDPQSPCSTHWGAGSFWRNSAPTVSQSWSRMTEPCAHTAFPSGSRGSACRPVGRVKAARSGCMHSGRALARRGSPPSMDAVADRFGTRAPTSGSSPSRTPASWWPRCSMASSWSWRRFPPGRHAAGISLGRRHAAPVGCGRRRADARDYSLLRPR